LPKTDILFFYFLIFYFVFSAPPPVQKNVPAPLIVECISSYVFHYPTNRHQCTCLGSVPNLNSRANSPFSEGWKLSYHIWK